ncbi:hypothetical protein GGI23_002604, partial [Coemansia sp. RSA 2559]
MASFNVLLRIEDLNNVPPLNGDFYAKWKFQDHSGTTPKYVVATPRAFPGQELQKLAPVCYILLILSMSAVAAAAAPLACLLCRVPVANREVRWLHAVEKTIDVPVSRDGMLTPCEFKVTIKQ